LRESSPAAKSSFLSNATGTTIRLSPTEYDAAFDELDDLGPIESALEEIIARWDEATTSVEAHNGPPGPAQ